MKCPSCDKGKIIVTMNTLTDKGWKKEKPTELECPICDGTGKIDNEMHQEIKKHEEDWCSCVEHDNDAYYVPDGKDSRLFKHHWRCSICDGIVQIG